MQLTQRELEFARLVKGARFAVESPAVVDLAISTLFKKPFGSRALEWGDEVVVSCLSSPVIIDSLVRHGLVPVFVDVCLPTYQVLLDEVEEAIDPDQCAAIFLPHVWGNPFDLRSIRDLADEYGLWLLSEGFLGSESDSELVGSVEDICVFMHHRALTCSSQIVYEQMKSSHLYSYWEKSPCVLDDHVRKSVDVFVAELDAYFEDHHEFEFPGSHDSAFPVWSSYPITLRKSCSFSRADFLDALNPLWYTKPATAWYEFRDPKRQEHRMYGIEAVVNNTVLLDPFYCEEVVNATKKFLEGRHGR